MQQHLRCCFEQWGLPQAIRVDNGDPWATRSDVPSALALWLVGLGVKVLLNRPCHSTDNGIVERCHGVLSGWVEAHKAADEHALQKQLDWALLMQRERYPACNNKSRLEAYPQLLHNSRLYRQCDEEVLWHFERVQDFLADFVWTRRVDKVGRVSIFSSAYSVGRSYAGRQVNLHLDWHTHEWVIESEQGQCLKRCVCQEITPERIYAFDMRKRANKAAHPPV